MSLLCVCSLSLHIEGIHPKELIYYAANSLEKDKVSKWIHTAAKKRRKNIDKAYITDSTDSIRMNMYSTVKKKILEEAQQTDDENEQVVYVDNPLEARLPCRWIRRNLLREIIKLRGKGNVKGDVKNKQDLAKQCLQQTEAINSRVKLPETTKEPILVVENPVEANIACPLISRSELRTIILNRAKDNVKGIAKTAEDSVFFRVPIKCAIEEEEILQIQGEIYATRPTRNTCIFSTTKAYSCINRTPLTPGNTADTNTVISTIKNTHDLPHDTPTTTPRNKFEPTTTVATSLPIPSTNNIIKMIKMNAIIDASRPENTKASTISSSPSNTIEATAMRVSTDTIKLKSTKRRTLEPTISDPTYSTASSETPRNSFESTAISAFNGNQRYTSKGSMHMKLLLIYSTRASMSPINTFEHITTSTGTPKATQRYTFEHTTTSTSTDRFKATHSYTFESTTINTSFAMPKATQRNTFEHTTSTTTGRPKATEINTFEHTTKSTSTDTPKATEINTFEQTTKSTSTDTPKDIEINTFKRVTTRNTYDTTMTSIITFINKYFTSKKSILGPTSPRTSVNTVKVDQINNTSMAQTTKISSSATNTSKVTMVNENISSANTERKIKKPKHNKKRRLKTTMRPPFSDGEFIY